MGKCNMRVADVPFWGSIPLFSIMCLHEHFVCPLKNGPGTGDRIDWSPAARSRCSDRDDADDVAGEWEPIWGVPA